MALEAEGGAMFRVPAETDARALRPHPQFIDLVGRESQSRTRRLER